MRTYLTWDIQFNGFDANIPGGGHLATAGTIGVLDTDWGRKARWNSKIVRGCLSTDAYEVLGLLYLLCAYEGDYVATWLGSGLFPMRKLPRERRFVVRMFHKEQFPWG